MIDKEAIAKGGVVQDAVDNLAGLLEASPALDCSSFECETRWQRLQELFDCGTSPRQSPARMMIMPWPAWRGTSAD